MFELPDERLRQIVREAILELGPQSDPALLRKVVKAVVQRLQQQQPELASTQQPSPPATNYSQY